MGLTNFPNGVSSFGMPVLGGGPLMTTGNVFYVDSGSTAASTNSTGTSPSQPMSTLASAMDKVTASNGDMIFVMPGHAETTTAVALDVAGVRIVGLGVGRTRPIFTATTAATDLFNVSAANITLENVILVGAASGCTALIDIGAADFHLKGCQLDCAATPVDIITVSAGARGIIEGNYFLGTAAGPDNAIFAEIKLENYVIQNNIFNFLQFDIDENIIDCPDKSAPGTIIADNLMLGVAAVAITVKSSVANQFTAFIGNDIVAHAAQVTIADLVKNSVVGVFFSRNFGTDVAAEDSAGIPATTPA